MKKDDEYICIKNVENFYYNRNNISHIKGNTYKVVSDSGFLNDGEYVYISSEKNTTYKGYLGFFVSGDKECYKNWERFNAHFATKQKYRKLKLKKIYESR